MFKINSTTPLKKTKSEKTTLENMDDLSLDMSSYTPSTADKSASGHKQGMAIRVNPTQGHIDSM